MNNFLYMGCSVSGKTNILKEKYENFIKREISENQILVFINSKSQSSKWRDIETNTFYKIIRNHIILFWPLIKEKIKTNNMIPKFLDIEISEYLLNKLVDKYRENGRFLDINIPNSVLSSDILNNISKLSLNCIEFNEIDKYLNKFLEIEDLLAKDNILAMKDIINVFVRKNISEGVLNFSLGCYLYDKYILNHPLYEKYLKNNIRYLIVDDIQEKSFLEIKFIEKLLNIVDESHLAYNTDGSVTRILGADEVSVKEIIFPKCNLIKLNQKEFIKKDKVIIKNSSLRSEMIINIADEVNNLVKKGYEPDEIDIIGSFVDSILENRLKKELSNKGLKLKVMTRSGALTDNPFINSLITISLLVNNSWNIIPNKDSIAKTLSLVLGIDMIRSRYLTSQITKKEPYELPSIDELPCETIGDIYLQKYKRLRSWIYENREIKVDVDIFLKKLFLDILLPLEASKENLTACNYLINLAKEFLDYAIENNKFKKDRNKMFIDMVLRGIRVSNTGNDEEDNVIRLWTTYSYLLGSKESKIQIWTDASSSIWHQIGIKKYYNPFIFLKENKDKTWEYEYENKYKVLQTNSIISRLLRKSSHTVYIFKSEFNSNGYEQKGELLEYLGEILKGEN
ncbi:hypothetical protein [Tepidibacter formicigenes]|jgi:hypothetical protein|uniref:Uncharacterized protein n=1 Tax=Tepidibacter formicigenes DSM 15518 TaxID=1123349 RepID=A0A1M6P3M6_9FIRM|nr:hypothetical protein [Tepidibacter formicigenes]SHK02492.1 hypothetical protein SAMN02744037_01446 [Tepidibacter formicigenes DSM 15518]